MTVAVTGGGTGGHIFPAMAVAEALHASRPDVEVVYIGGIGGREETIVRANGLPFYGVPARKIRRTMSPDTLLSLAVLCRGYLRARGTLRRRSVTAVLGTGGYVAAAAVLAASHLRLPVVIHEQNAIAGRTNRWLAQKADKVCITFAVSAREFPQDKVVETGLPVRSGLVSDLSAAEAREKLEVPPEAFTILAVGGSQGAAAINRVVWEAMGRWDAGTAVIHQTGVTTEVVPDGGPGYRSFAFMDTETLALAYRAADMVICRCGASTLAEIALAGLPALLVPYPAAYADHQTANARAMADAGAGILLPQSELTADRLVTEVRRMRSDEPLRRGMSEASLSLARPRAAHAVAQVVLDCADVKARGSR